MRVLIAEGAALPPTGFRDRGLSVEAMGDGV